jgi:hypothetical protein
MLLLLRRLLLLLLLLLLQAMPSSILSTLHFSMRANAPSGVYSAT